MPTTDPLLEADDGHQAVDAHLQVVPPASKIVEHAHLMASSGEVEPGGPTQITVATEH